MTVISLIDLRPAVKGVSSPIADQAPALGAPSISQQQSKHAADAESEPRMCLTSRRARSG